MGRQQERTKVTKELQSSQEKMTKNGNSKSLPFNNYLSVNGLNHPIKRHTVTE